MAAGLGFKTFTTGEVLTAADTNGYLMQGVLVFASAAARDAAITSPQEGQCCYLKDTDAVLTYSGAAWVGFDDSNAIQNTIVAAKGDIIGASANDVPAVTSVGANETRLVADSAQTTGLKYVADTTNYAIAAKGDLLAGTAADTLAALTVGANGTVLTADSGETTGLKYGGAWTTYTPSLTNLTIGNGTQIARFQKIGNTINFVLRITFGSTTSVSGDFNFTVPEPHDGNFYGNLYAAAWDNSAGVLYSMAAFTFSTSDVYFRAIQTTGNYTSSTAISSTVPFTWATADVITCSGSYEV